VECRVHLICFFNVISADGHLFRNAEYTGYFLSSFLWKEFSKFCWTKVNYIIYITLLVLKVLFQRYCGDNTFPVFDLTKHEPDCRPEFTDNLAKCTRAFQSKYFYTVDQKDLLAGSSLICRYVIIYISC
jgi:hypothetical protein